MSRGDVWTGRSETVAEVGLNPRRVEALLTRVRRDVEEGALPAVQIALARHGKIAVMESYGSASDDSLICLFSATKAIVSAAAWLLFQEGRLAEDELVADIIPEFGSNGKERVSVGQLFTHMAGFPFAPFTPLDWASREARLRRFSRWRLNWEPGSRLEYHPSSSMWVIAEIIERRSGQAYTDFIRTRVFKPLRLQNIFVGLPDSENRRVLPVEYCGEAMKPEAYDALGMTALSGNELNEEVLLAFNRPDVRGAGVPGAGGLANARDLALFYQALLHGGLNGVELWKEPMRAAARKIRTGELVDPLFNKKANRGLGIVVSGDEDRRFRGFGATNSPLAFGHNGVGCQLAWVDPVSGISLAYLTPGIDRSFIMQWRRCWEVGDLAAQCAS